MIYEKIKKGFLGSVGDFDDLLIRLEEEQSFDDIFISQGLPILIKSQGDLISVGTEEISEYEVNTLTNLLYKGNNGVTEIGKGQDIDVSYSAVNSTTGVAYKYRVNIVGVRGKNDSNNIRITMRSIKDTPLNIADLGLEQEVVDGLYPRQGIVLVCGETGSGKSTLLAAVIRGILEDQNEHVVICEYSAPVETTYHKVECKNSVIFQSEVGKDVPSFGAGIRNALRSNPDIILIGEMRDEETIRAGVGVSLMGQRVYSTAHSSSVSEAFSRLLLVYPPNEQKSKMLDLLGSVRGIIVQQLVKKKDGGRIGARSWLFFDESIRVSLKKVGLEHVTSCIDELVETKGQTMQKSLQILFDDGVISTETFERSTRGN